MFCSIESAASRKLKKERAKDSSSLRNVLSIRILRSVWVGGLAFATALILAKQLHYQSSSDRRKWAQVTKTYESTETIGAN